MATFSTTETLIGHPNAVPAMSKAICDYFESEGYSVKEEEGYTGGKEISITKGGMFKALLGLRTALKVSLQPMGETIGFKASAGIFGMHAIPTFITLWVCWPVILTQIWGLIKQSRLDDKALEIAQSVLSKYNYSGNEHTFGGYCHHCGRSIPNGTRFCPHCGNQMCA